MDSYFYLIFGSFFTVLAFLMARQIQYIRRLSLPENIRKYSLAKLNHFSRGQFVNFFVPLYAYFGGILVLNQMFEILNMSRMKRDILLVFFVVTFYFFLSLMMSYWQVFKLEEKFGFNKTTRTLFFMDQAKQLVLLLMIAAIAQCTIWIGGEMWWLLLWILGMIGFTELGRIQSFLYDTLTPLPQGPLREKIIQLAQECHFEFADIYVVDKSKRSLHSNAYFTGFGRHKRIVLDDNLINQLDDDSIKGVCAHELGHYQLRHELKYFALVGALALVGLWFIDQLFQPQWFNLPNNISPLVTVLILAPMLIFTVQPLLMWVLRSFEWQADQFALDRVSGKFLATALEKLSMNNKMIQSADPLYIIFYYSHPPIKERLAALKGVK